MIFAKTADKVLAGEKTQTRRPVKPDESFNGIEVYDGTGRLKWRVWNTYAVQPGRSKKSVGRIQLTNIRIERLYQITTEDARAEGFSGRGSLSGRDEFTRVWKELYPDDGSFFWRVYVLEFELVKEEG